MKKTYRFLSLVVALLLTGCGQTSSDSVTSSLSNNRIIINDYEVGVRDRHTISAIFTIENEPLTYAFDGHNIAIEGNEVYGLLADTETVVTATAESGASTTFTVYVEEEPYASIAIQESSEGWMNPITITPVEGVDEDYPLGIDVSMVKQIYDNGGQYYNHEGVAQDVYQILKSHGVNYIRIRLWNDPYNHIIDANQNVTKVTYGGGINDLETDLVIAKDAVAAGLKILLDFHYSDFWADPSNQVIPKAWKDFTTPAQVEEALYTFTKETLEAFEAVGALPHMVQIGNETTPGLFTQYPGPTNSTLTGNSPYYLTQKTALSRDIAGTSGSANFIRYIQAGIRATHDVSEEILTMIHLARGLSNTSGIINYFNQFSEVDYDIIGLSTYTYYHGSPATIASGAQAVANAFPDKKITFAETAYAFTLANHPQTSNIFGTEQIETGYPVTVQGQATMLRDIIDANASLPNGYGVFYWEGCWLPIRGAGWADANTKSSWSNQALFSYDGKALPSLNVFNLVQGKTV